MLFRSVSFYHSFASMQANLSSAYFVQGGVVLICLYPQYSYALYLDSSMNIKKKDYTHIKNVLDSAIFTYSLTGGYIKAKNTRTKRRLSAIIPTSGASINQTVVGLLDSTTCITRSSSEGIDNAFACHLIPVMPRFSAGPQA